MDLNIKYQNGEMVIHLEEFLGCRSISKFRKLIKIIRTSYTPDEEQKIKDFIEQEFEQFEPMAKENEKYIIGYTEKVKFCQKQLDNSVFNRSKFKKCSDGYNHYNEIVKSNREELREIKALLRSRQQDLDRGRRNKQFYKTCLEFIS